MGGYSIDVDEIPKWIKGLSEITDNLLTQKENLDSVFLQKYIEKVNVAIKNLNLLGGNFSRYLSYPKRGNWKNFPLYKLEKLELSDNKIETYSSESISVLLMAKSNLQKLSKKISSDGRKEKIEACKKAAELINEIIEEIEKIETLSKTENKQAIETEKLEEPKQQASQDNGQKNYSAEKMEAIKIVSQNGLALANLSPEMRNDSNVIIAAFKQNPKSLEYVSKDMVLEILAKTNYNKNVFYYISPLLKQDKDFIMEVISKNPELVHQCKTIVSSDTLAMHSYVTGGHHLEETISKLNLVDEKVYKSFSLLARNVYRMEIAEQLIKKGINVSSPKSIPIEILVEIEKKLNQIQQIIDKARVTQVKDLRDKLFNKSSLEPENNQEPVEENNKEPEVEKIQVVEEETQISDVEPENNQELVEENNKESEAEKIQVVEEETQISDVEPENNQESVEENNKESEAEKIQVVEEKTQISDVKPENNQEPVEENEAEITQENPNQVSENLSLNQGETLRKKFNVNDENEMNKLLDFYTQMNVAYYNKKDRTAEEIKLRRRINAQFKRIIDKKANALIENENNAESNFEQKIQEINNGIMFAADDIDEIAKSKGATIKLFQIMSSGVYEKDGVRTRLSQKQRCALANVLQKVSERKLDIENAKLSEKGKAVKNNAASTKLNESEKGE